MIVIIKKLLLMFLLLFYCIVAYADISGKWAIDFDLTIKFNGKNLGLNELEKDFLKCLSVNSFLKLDKNRLIDVINEHDCLIGNEFKNIIGSKAGIEYKKIFESDDVFIFVTIDEENIETVNTIHLVNDNLFWVYYPGDKPEYNSHIRFYYKKEVASPTYD